MLDDLYLGEIRVFSSNYVPRGWALCEGQKLQIKQHALLFQLLGTQYGGDGVETFHLPDMRGRTPIGMSDSGVGSKGGAETVALRESQMPRHRHHVMCDDTANVMINTGAPSARSVPSSVVRGPAPGSPSRLKLHQSARTAGQSGPHLVALEEGLISQEGQGKPHENRQPYLVMRHCISLTGLFPTKDEA